MAHLPYDATDDDIVAFVDQWAGLLEAGNYAQAFSFTAHIEGCTLTPKTFGDHIKLQAALHASCFDRRYGALEPPYRVTARGLPTHLSQVKDVTRWPRNEHGEVGEVWYNLNMNGFATEYTALFYLYDHGDGITISLADVGVR